MNTALVETRITTWDVLKTGLKVGLIGGIIGVMIALQGMLQAFNVRDIISGIVTTSQVLMIITFFGAAYYAVSRCGSKNVFLTLVVGALTSFVSSLFLVGLIALGGVIKLGDMFINAVPDVYALLTFKQGLTTGSVYLVLFAVVSGLVAAVIFQLPSNFKRAIVNGLVAVVAFGLLQDLIKVTLSNWEQLTALTKFFFESNGLSSSGAVTLFVLVAVLSYLQSVQGNRLANAAEKAAARDAQDHAVDLFRSPGSFDPPAPGLPRALHQRCAGHGWAVSPDGSGVEHRRRLCRLARPRLRGVLRDRSLHDWDSHVARTRDGHHPQLVAGAAFRRRRGLDGRHFPRHPRAANARRLSCHRDAWLWRDHSPPGQLGLFEAVGGWRAGHPGHSTAGHWSHQFAQMQLELPILGQFQFTPSQEFYYLFVAGCLLVIFIATRVKSSRIGRAWMAVREDEDVAQAMGINLVTTKLLAFGMGASFGGLSGAIFASKLQSVYPTSFSFLVSVYVLSLIIIGGMGSIPGVVVGALALVGLPELLREVGDYRYLFFGAALVLMMLVRPEGLLPEARRRMELEEFREEEAEEAVPRESAAT